MTDNKKFEKLKKLADAMYYAANYLTTDASRLHKAMDEYHKFIIHEYREEPVSEDKFVSHEEIATMADKASKECGVSIDEEFERLAISEGLDDYSKEILSWEDSHEDWDRHVIRKTAKHFTDWQKQKNVKWLKSNINCNMWIKDFIKNMEE